MLKINLVLFGHVYDLTEDLSTEKSTIKVNEKEYPINDGFKTVMELDKVFKEDIADAAFVEKFLVITLGKAAAKELLDMNLKMSFYKKIIKIIGDEIKGSDDESDSGTAE